MEAKPNRLSIEQKIKEALTTYEEAYRDENSGTRVNGAVPHMTADQAWQELKAHRTQTGGEETYRRLIQDAEKKRLG